MERIATYCKYRKWKELLLIVIVGVNIENGPASATGGFLSQLPGTSAYKEGEVGFLSNDAVLPFLPYGQGFQTSPETDEERKRSYRQFREEQKREQERHEREERYCTLITFMFYALVHTYTWYSTVMPGV